MLSAPASQPRLRTTRNSRGVPMSRSMRLAVAAALFASVTLPVAAQTPAAAKATPGFPNPGRVAGINVGTPEDRAAIERLMWTYDRMLDTYNADAYAKLFTP